MGQREKAVERMQTLPKDVSFDEFCRFLGYFGYNVDNKGKTSGSRVRFVRDGSVPILMHKPHSQKWMWWQDIKNAVQLLEREGLL